VDSSRTALSPAMRSLSKFGKSDHGMTHATVSSSCPRDRSAIRVRPVRRWRDKPQAWPRKEAV
jgi:hypothetical protein